jgi:hypothetical protein
MLEFEEHNKGEIVKVRINQESNYSLLISFLLSSSDKRVPIKMASFEYMGRTITYNSLRVLLRYLEEARIVKIEVAKFRYTNANGSTVFKSKPTTLIINRRRLIEYVRNQR